MLGEVARRQLGEVEGGEGAAGLPLSPAPHGLQREGRWLMGNWATAGQEQGKPKLKTGLCPNGMPEGCGRVF